MFEVVLVFYIIVKGYFKLFNEIIFRLIFYRVGVVEVVVIKVVGNLFIERNWNLLMWGIFYYRVVYMVNFNVEVL